jgi:hypothetical protein
VLKLEISYNRVIIGILKDFWFLLEDFLKIIFWHGEIFEVSIILKKERKKENIAKHRCYLVSASNEMA